MISQHLSPMLRSIVLIGLTISFTGCSTAAKVDEDLASSQAKDEPTTEFFQQSTDPSRPATEVMISTTTHVGSAVVTPVVLSGVQTTEASLDGPQVPFVFVAGQQGENTIHVPGEAFSVDVAVDSDANLYCYLFDENKRVNQFFPNPIQPSPRVSAGTRMQFPGDFPFLLIANQQKIVERVTCMAASESVGLVPLKNLPFAESVEEIHHAFHQAAGQDTLIGVGTYDVRFK